jgi:Protein of unknown function (DUF3093)
VQLNANPLDVVRRIHSNVQNDLGFVRLVLAPLDGVAGFGHQPVEWWLGRARELAYQKGFYDLLRNVADYGKDLYYEAKRWGFGLWLFIAFLYLTLVIALLVSINTGATLVIAIPLAALIIYYYFHTALKIRVTKGWLVVGKANIERAFISDCQALVGKDFTEATRKDFHPDAYFQNRPWLQGGVKITLRDPKDPTPYWLIASKDPIKLAAALNSEGHGF